MRFLVSGMSFGEVTTAEKWEVFWLGDDAAQKTSAFQYSHYIPLVDVVDFFFCHEFMTILPHSVFSTRPNTRFF